MKEQFRNKLVVVLWSVLLLAACTTGEKHALHQAARYTCPMHPQIVAEEPGTCPICKMDLVPVDQGPGHEGADDSLARLVKPTNSVVISGIRTVKPSRGSRFGELTFKGVINYDPDRVNSVSARVPGRIERLYVSYNFERVRKGQKLMEIYSPDLAAAQSELLFLHTNGDTRLADAARRRLLLLGMTDSQIGRILRTGQVDYRVTLYSPYSGYLSEEAGNPEGPPTGSAPAGGTVISGSSGSGSMGGGSMDGMSAGPVARTAAPEPPVSTGTPLAIREGQYISAGQKLFTLVDPGAVRAEFFVNPEELDQFHRGTPVHISAADIPGLAADTRVSLIQPYYGQGTSFSMVRAVISNAAGKWKIGQLISIRKDTGKQDGTWLPRTAVLRTGSRYVAFVRKPFGFVPVHVRVNRVLGDWADIGTSLPAETAVAENAWFLVDSESFVKVDSLKQ